MNIFFLHTDPTKSANYYFNKHCIKIILEITQMLYAAWRFQGHDLSNWIQDHVESIQLKPYKSTHYNHPTTKWVRSHPNNYKYACRMALALCHEYTNRYNRIHACLVRIQWLINHIPMCEPQDYGTAFLATVEVPDGCTPIPLAMPVHYHTANVIQAYRTYYISDKHRMAQHPTAVERNCIEWNMDLPSTDSQTDDSQESTSSSTSSSSYSSSYSSSSYALTIPQLKDYCRANGLRGYSKCKNKQALIDFINQAV